MIDKTHPGRARSPCLQKVVEILPRRLLDTFLLKLQL